MEPIEELDSVIKNLNNRGYTLDFNPDRTSSVPWGISAPWPSELEFEVDDAIDSFCNRQGEQFLLKVLAVRTKKFNLKGIVITVIDQEKLWSIDEILNKFKGMPLISRWFGKK